MFDRVAVCSPDVDGEFAHALFDRSRHVDIDDIAAFRADQMVMMSREVLRELVTSGVIGGHEPVHNTCFFEDRKVAIRGTLGESAGQIEEIGDGDGSVGNRKSLNQCPPVGRVPLPVALETFAGGPVEFGG